MNTSQIGTPPAPAPSSASSRPAGGSAGGGGDFGNGTWPTSGSMPQDYEDFMHGMMKQQQEFMKQNEKFVKKLMTSSPDFPPMRPMLGMPGFGGSSGVLGGFPGVGALSDGTSGPQTSSSFGELTETPRKTSRGRNHGPPPVGTPSSP